MQTNRSGSASIHGWACPCVVGLLVLFGGLSRPGAAFAELKPEEIAVLTAASSPGSKEIADHYIRRRGIPASNLIPVDVRPNPDLSRAEWEQTVRPAIRKALQAPALQGKIRCLVLAGDLPLRVGPAPNAAADAAARKTRLTTLRQAKLDRLAAALGTVDAVGRSPFLAVTPSFDMKTPLGEIAERAEKTINEAATRLRSRDESVRQAGFIELEKCLAAVGGMEAVLSTALQHPNAAAPAGAERVAALRRDLQKHTDEIQQLLFDLDTAERDEKLAARLETACGILGVVRWIDEQRLALEKCETQSSLDGELVLLDWPPYPLSLWQPNPLFYLSPPAAKKRPMFLVARLAGPRVEAVKKQIDDAIEIEKTGLQGTFYIDARHLTYDPKSNVRGGYPEYDQSLRNLAERLQKHTSLKVVLDDKPALFARGECPDAALYCGWYSPRKYVDAFTWRPGSVAYHIASFEAVSLNRSDSEFWCPAMLERGVTATLGPTFEPYLAAFPLPDDFFSLLLTDRYGLGETCYRTCPFASWAMILLGDPLYRPFKTKPALDDSALPDRLRAALPPRKP